MFYCIPESRKDDWRKAVGIITSLFGDVYGADMLICMGRNLSFRDNKKFMASFDAAATDARERSLLWRLHVLAWAAENALKVEGDFVECGVFKGFSSAVLCRYLDFGALPRRFYLYDTFSGLSSETSTEQERELWDYSGFDGDSLYSQVLETFSGYTNVEVVRGTVPYAFEEKAPEKVAYLHIDMNSEKAEILALEGLFDRVSPGGVIVLDDFGWVCNKNQMRAELAFMKDKGLPVLELPTGQGLVVKH